MLYSPDGKLITRSEFENKRVEGLISASQILNATIPEKAFVLKTLQEFLGTGREKRVLVIRNGGLGDVLCVTPFLRYLSRNLGLEVDFMTDYVSLLDLNPYVRKVFRVDHEYADAQHTLWYDGVLDLCGYVEKPENLLQHRPSAFAASVEIDLEDDISLDFFLSREERAWAARKLSDYPYTGYPGPIAYVWKSSTENRNWSLATHASVIGTLVRAGYTLVIVDNDSQPLPSSSRIINLSGVLSIREAAAIMSRCSMVITPDTGMFHIASALNLPIITYFGAFPLEERATTERVVSLSDPQSNCPVAPCRNYACPFLEGQAPCLNVSPEEVLQAVRGILSRS